MKAKGTLDGNPELCLPDPCSDPFREGRPQAPFIVRFPGQDLAECKPLGAEL